MELTAATAARRSSLTGLARAFDGWALVTVVIAFVVAAPLLGLPLSFLLAGDAISDFSGLLPEAAVATVVLVAGVGAGTLVLGTGMAALVSFWDFPGRGWIEWVLVLPLAVPGYVFTLFALGVGVPGIRSPAGAVAIFTLVLYPYVYLLGRAAFLSQPRALVEQAQALGLSHGRALLRVALPIARPALLGGVALALMETLADFGTVNLLGVQAFPNAIYKVWFGAFDRDAALQLASLLMLVTLTLLTLERLARGRRRYAENAARGQALVPVRLRGWRAAAAPVLPLALVALVAGAPLVQLGIWAARALGNDALAPGFATQARNSLLLAAVAAAIVTGVGLVLAYGLRSTRTRTGATGVRLATIGYGVPGSVVAVAVLAPLGWIDHRLDGLAGTGLILTGTVIGLVCAYAVRFLALAFQSVETGLDRIPRSLDEAARGLGSDRLDVLARIHVPLLGTGLLTALLLVFTEVMKELPATLLMRPLGGDTLAIGVWQATTESLYRTAALPALLIVLAGLLPVGLLIRLSRRAAAA